VSNAKAHILVVDDDPDFVRAHQISLEQAGFRVSTASNGTEALKNLRTKAIDLVMLDVMMDYATEGLHVTYAIREDPALREIPVLMVTSLEEQTGEKFDPATDGEFLPVSDFVRKPIRPGELVAKVQKLLKQAGKA